MKDYIIVYSCLYPYNFPPSFYYDYAKSLAHYTHEVIYIDLYSTKSDKKWWFGYYQLFKTVRNLLMNKPGIWIYIPKVGKFSNQILKLYLLIKKYFFSKKIVFYTMNSFSDPIYNYIPADKKVFDCLDRRESEFENNKKLIEEFDLILVANRLLQGQLKDINPNRVKVIPTGYTKGNFKNYSFVKVRNISGSVVFFGGISHRLDFELLYKVMNKLRRVGFYFIGEEYLNVYYKDKNDFKLFTEWKRIKKLPNCYYLGKMDKEVYKKLLSSFSVGIIPYSTDDIFNYYSYPMKLFDYLLARLPVVSTDIPNVKIHSKVFPIFIAKDWREFVNHINKQIKKGSLVSTNSIRKFYKYHHMKNKIKFVDKYLQSLFLNYPN